MARGLEREDSVYDFIYVDSRRLAIFLSQFGPYGHLTALTRSSAQTGSKSSGSDLKFVKENVAQTAQDAQSEEFDTQWIAPLVFLDKAQQRGMINRSLEDARIGHLSLVTGTLALFDLGVVQSAWGLEHVKNLLAAESFRSTQAAPRSARRRSAQDKTSATTAVEAALSLLKTFPHAILTTIKVGDQSVWTSLQPDGLIGQAGDMMIKHGVRVAGEWSMIGVIDALPDPDETEDVSLMSQAAAAESLGSLGGFIAGIAPAARGMLGRPPEAFGMTPLLIFREVSSPANI